MFDADEFPENDNGTNEYNPNESFEYNPEVPNEGTDEYVPDNSSDEPLPPEDINSLDALINQENSSDVMSGIMNDFGSEGIFATEKNTNTEDSEPINETNTANDGMQVYDTTDIGEDSSEDDFIKDALSSTNKNLVKTESEDNPDDYIEGNEVRDEEIKPFAAEEAQEKPKQEDANDEYDTTTIGEDGEVSYGESDEEKKASEDISFVAKGKISAGEADANGPKSKPKVLNKKLLLSIVVGVLCFIVILTVLMPTKKEKDSENSESNYPEQQKLSDYKQYATQADDATVAGRYDDIIGYDANGVPIYSKKNTASSGSSTSAETGKRQTQYDENGNVIIPPIIPDQGTNSSYVYTQPTTTTGSTGSTISIPDTRNDSLHGKTISGIKGLTGSQQQYATDYYQTMNKNSGTTSNILDGYSEYSLPSKEEYTANILNQYKDLYSGNNQSAYSTQNDQNGKNSFYSNGRDGEGVGTGQYLPTNTIWQGTIFEAVLTSELNTDLPGEITARVAKNIYSSQDGRYLLIPQNSILYGTYNSSISYSQNRVQVGWHTIVRPDGYSINIGNMSGTDAKGASGLKGFVNEHPLAYLKAIGLMTTLSIVDSEYQAQLGNTNSNILKNLLNSSKEVTEPLGEKIVDRAINIQPTIVIKAGTKLNIVANQTLTLPPYEQIPVTEKYRKY